MFCSTVLCKKNKRKRLGEKKYEWENPKADLLQCSAATCLIILVLFILILTYHSRSDNGLEVTAYYSLLSLCTWGWQDQHFLCKACWEVLSADAVHRDVILLVSHPCHLSISPKKPLQPPTTLLYPGHRAQAATSLRTPLICSCDAKLYHLHCLIFCFVIFAFWYFEEEMMMDFKKTEKNNTNKQSVRNCKVLCYKITLTKVEGCQCKKYNNTISRERISYKRTN